MINIIFFKTRGNIRIQSIDMKVLKIELKYN